MTVLDSGARLRTRFDLTTLEDRVRRDAGRTSAAVTVLWAAVLVTLVFATNWLLNIQPPAPERPPGPVRGQIIVVPPGESGKRGQAVDLGDHPDATDDFPGDAVPAQDAALPELTRHILEAVDRAIPINADGPAGRGIIGGKIGQNDVGDGPDAATIPSHQRWAIEWGTDTELAYRRKLDHFGIFLGAVREGRLVGAVRGFEVARREATAKPPEFWFVHLDRARTELDRKLLQGAGVDVRPTDVVAQFVPAAVLAKMASLEERHSHKNASQIKKTVFGIRAVGAGYELFIVEQRLK